MKEEEEKEEEEEEEEEEEKTAPKNEDSDIEHGSSDWSKNGEQYRVLSNKHGIILAQNNYLPVDKRGNVNVLVVGRIRFW